MEVDEDSNITEKLPNDGANSNKKKRKIQPYHRIKAHANPLSDMIGEYPLCPSQMDWSKYYPKESLHNKKIENADIGCGYGGLLVGLSTTFPNEISLGIEIRDKVVEYVEDRIAKLREENKSEGKYKNIAVIKSNAMKYLPNYFAKGQLKRIFFLFPDPHFKKSNHRRRIITPQLLAEYAYALQKGGLAYIATDVEELYEWMTSHFNRHPLFVPLNEKEMEADAAVPLITTVTEEARKVDRMKGKKWMAVYRRI